MAMTYEEYHGLVEALLAHPEWRAELRPLILGEEFLSLPRGQQRSDDRLDRVEDLLRQSAERQSSIDAQIAANSAAIAAGLERQDRLDAQIAAGVERQDRLDAQIAAGVERQDRLDARLAELAEQQARTDAEVTALIERMDHFDERLVEVLARLTRVEGRIDLLDVRMNRVEGRLGNIEGGLLEQRYRDQVRNWFAEWLWPVRAVVPDDLAQVREAFATGTLTTGDMAALRALDLIVAGTGRASGEEEAFCVEVSYVVNVDDVARAHARAAILRRAGLRATGVAGGYRATAEAEELAATLGVLVDTRRVPAGTFLPEG